MMGRMLNFLGPVLPARFRADRPVIPVVRLSGVIGFSTPLRPGLTLATVARPLERAFSVRRAKAVALLINSPGGSPVQSHLIFRRIRQLATENEVPVLAFVEDVAASGGYMLACAADEIICDVSSIMGSIGVVAASFGFDEAMKKLGIERRLYTAGEHKVILDPFLPAKDEDVARLRSIQKDIHQTFIELVKSRRGAKLSGPEAALFSGEFWAGAKAIELGIADQIGDVRSYLRERYGEKVVTPLVRAERGLLGRVAPGFSTNAPTQAGGWADDVVSALETRALWSRYGL